MRRRTEQLQKANEKLRKDLEEAKKSESNKLQVPPRTAALDAQEAYRTFLHDHILQAAPVLAPTPATQAAKRQRVEPLDNTSEKPRQLKSKDDADNAEMLRPE